MVVTLTLPARGAQNWATNSATGLNVNLTNIVADLNALSVSGVTGETFFGVNTQSSGSNIVLTSLANFQFITLTSSSLSLTMPDMTGSEFFDGAWIYVINEGPTNSFDIKDDGGTNIFTSLKPGRMVTLLLKSDATADGTWRVQDDITVDELHVVHVAETAFSLGGAVGGAVAIDYEDGTYQYGTVTSNITGITISNLPSNTDEVGALTVELIQDGGGGNTIDLTGGVFRSADGASIILSTTGGAIDKLRFETRDGGTLIDVFLNTDFTVIT